MAYSSESTINIQFMPVSLLKVKKQLHFWGGGSEGQKIRSAGLPLPNIFRKRGGGALIKGYDRST